MAVPFNGLTDGSPPWQFFSQAGVVVVSVFDLDRGAERDAPCDWGMDRAH
jgi:hypothetical protein